MGHVVAETEVNGRHMTPVTCLQCYCAQCSAPQGKVSDVQNKSGIQKTFPESH